MMRGYGLCAGCGLHALRAWVFCAGDAAPGRISEQVIVGSGVQCGGDKGAKEREYDDLLHGNPPGEHISYQGWWKYNMNHGDSRKRADENTLMIVNNKVKHNKCESLPGLSAVGLVM